jgi:hypothetical protein
MKRSAVACLFFLFIHVTALAQPILTPETESFIREFVAKDKPKPVKVTGQLAVGQPAPNSAELLPLEGLSDRAPALLAYRYFVADDKRIVIVDPRNRNIIHIISPTI